MLIGLVLAAHPCLAQNLVPSRYPNELPDYRFFNSAKWRTLVPLVSTMADVRKALGDPAEASENYGLDPYPGDAAAKRPIFIYDMDAKWRLYVYFAGSRGDHPKIPDRLHDRIFSFEMLPRDPLPFRIKFPAVFKRRDVMAADASWDEYTDGVGLSYNVYKSYTPYGHTKPGDLDRIVYGPSPEELKRVEGK